MVPSALLEDQQKRSKTGQKIKNSDNSSSLYYYHFTIDFLCMILRKKKVVLSKLALSLWK